MTSPLRKTELSAEPSFFSDKKLGILLDSAPDAVVIIREGGSIELVNRQAERWFGYERCSIVGKPLETLLPERFRARHIIHRAHYSENPVPRPMGTGLELFGRRVDGSEFPVDISVGSLNFNGDTFFIANIRDITEKKRMEADRVDALRCKEELLGVIAHDLKNPLTAILASVELAPRVFGPLPAPEARRWMQCVRTAAEQMDGLIRGILLSHKAKSGVLSLDKRPCEANALLQRAIDVVAPIVVRKSIRLERKICEEKPLCQCDPERILQALSNLLSNAIKFTPEGGKIEVQIERSAGMICFSVSDTGCGIPETDIPHLFEPYWQSRKTARQGSGLGLSIVKGIVEAHGGRVGVQSHPGHGSLFYFTIPLA